MEMQVELLTVPVGQMDINLGGNGRVLTVMQAGLLIVQAAGIPLIILELYGIIKYPLNSLTPILKEHKKLDIHQKHS